MTLLKNCKLAVPALLAAMVLFPRILPAQTSVLITDEAQNRRAAIFAAAAEDFGFEPSEEHPHVWSVMMETHHPPTVITFVTALGGNANVYFSNGNKISGAGKDPAVFAATEKLMKAAEENKNLFEPTPREILFPYAGQAQFYLFTFSDGILMASAEEIEMKDGDHPLSPLYLAAQEVITAIREVVENQNGS